MQVLVINGPNLNLLGKRNIKQYGSKNLLELEDLILSKHRDTIFLQSNYEGEIIEAIQKTTCPIVINPGAYGHYSYAIRDAIEAIDYPVVEVHITDINNREEFRKKLVLSEVCKSTIIGRGFDGYIDAIKILEEE